MFNQLKKAYLLLANGRMFEGKSIGSKGTTIGEIVFATAMTGYQETLTDPSYYGQIVTQTFPLIGNYGTNSIDVESNNTYLNGYIVRELCELPSNFRCENTLGEFLEKQNVVGIADIDTRCLTRIIREHGVMNGMITTEEIKDIDKALEQINAFTIKDAVKTVSCKEKSYHKVENATKEVVLFDFGYKYNILRKLNNLGCNVTVVPYNTTAEEVKAMNPDGIMLSNGPGDPAENIEVIENLKDIIKLQIPIFGICLGHQLMALANNAKTHKLKYGHRGANQPVIDLKVDRTYVTSQNHGYAVESDSIDSTVGTVSHINANDKTCEGVSYFNTKAFTVQFHPEACGGPLDTSYLFDRFINLMDGKEV
ncbi:carbamoyl phosphate synthase small subunit [Paludicola sp. MB14-C6]|uniref:carbamoyl phosphate synthase small subunit n=1 Tax=Paludihabitans sp. MB14-C6 TaxID=3070656 RepID=UPI0027DD9074|nr:carbamoyl phosphate synthase small subunit [Paludicola sp. MB14-C6]WMJ22415.1 carbamoyl phosphate synthase small subunit [Paludicola sp. MB14-C6]